MMLIHEAVISAIDMGATVLALPSLAASVYLAGGTVLARRHPVSFGHGANLRWCIVVPAHDEAQGIAETLRSLHALDYASTQVTVLVIADNCTDDTAGIARQHGALVIERVDPERRGKGFALEHAFDHLLTSDVVVWDGVLVIDADSDVSPNLLRECSGAIEAGARAVQALYLPRPRAAHEFVQVSDLVPRIALTAFHEVRSLARSRLGCSTGLRGNGMAFTREVLEHFPHRAHSLTEDVEYGMMLGAHGVSVTYVGAAKVCGEMPVSAAAATTQGQRWLAGRALLRRRWTAPLVRAVLRDRTRLPLDLLIDLWIPPLSRLVLYTVAAAALVLALGLTGVVLPMTAIGCGVSAWLLGWHVIDATRRAGVAARPIAITLALAKHCVARWHHARLATRFTTLSWQRTPRSHERTC